MQAPKGNIITRRNFLNLAVIGAGTSAVGIYLIDKDGAVDYSDPAYLYWSRNSQGNLNLENYLVLCASLAPSAHNTQPWKFTIGDKEISIIADLDRNLGNADKERRMMLISIGCALENLRTAASHLGVATDITFQADDQFTSSGLCAKVKLSIGGQTPGSDKGLFDAIFRRQTTRAPYGEKAVPDATKAALASMNDFSGLSLRWHDTPSELNSLAMLNDEAAVAFTQDDSSYLDSLKWWRYSRKEILQKRDGISIFTSAAPSLIKQYFQYQVDQHDMAGDFGRQGEIDLMKKLFQATPLWGVISANQLSNTSRLQAGQLFERIFLEATRQDFRIQAISYVSEQPQYAEKYKSLFDLPKSHDLVLLFRMGKSDLCERSVRLPLHQIIT